MKRLVCLVAVSMGAAIGGADARAETLNIVSTGITGAQTFLNVTVSYSWTFTVSGSQTFDAVQAQFALKKSQSLAADAVVELQTANASFQPTGVVASFAFPAASGSRSTFRTETFALSSSSVTLSGNYYLTLESAAPGGGDTWFVKDPSASVAFENGSGATISSISGGGAVPVPEPTPLAGALVAGVVLVARRRLGTLQQKIANAIA